MSCNPRTRSRRGGEEERRGEGEEGRWSGEEEEEWKEEEWKEEEGSEEELGSVPVICNNLQRALYLSLRYQFVTPLTSLVVIKPDTIEKVSFLNFKIFHYLIDKIYLLSLRETLLRQICSTERSSSTPVDLPPTPLVYYNQSSSSSSSSFVSHIDVSCANLLAVSLNFSLNKVKECCHLYLFRQNGSSKNESCSFEWMSVGQ